MQSSHLCVKPYHLRIIRLLQYEDELIAQGVYITVETDTVLVMFIGPKGTPYAYGAYFFKIVVSDSDTTISHLLNDDEITYHPYFLPNGQTRLPILERHRPELYVLIMSMIPIFDSYPLYLAGRTTEREVLQFNQIVFYYNLINRTYRLLQNPSLYPTEFFEPLKHHFLANHREIEKLVELYRELDGKSNTCPKYSFTVKYDYNLLLHEHQSTVQRLSTTITEEAKCALERDKAKRSCLTYIPSALKLTFGIATGLVLGSWFVITKN